jgi:hypothetical protein
MLEFLSCTVMNYQFERELIFKDDTHRTIIIKANTLTDLAEMTKKIVDVFEVDNVEILMELEKENR